MKSGFDLEAYLQRIAYSGPRTATLDTLAAIHLRHALTIPFENLNPFLGWPVRLDEDSLQQKLVRDGRGGYCFEQNRLFSHALEALGFRVTCLAARVLWNSPPDAVTARSHMLLLIDLDDRRYIADVGFGGFTLTTPLLFQAGIDQSTPHEPFRLSEKGDSFLLEARIHETWKALYRFDLQEQFAVDYEVTNWYLSNHPASYFVTGLIAARPDPDRRYALRDNELAVHHLGGATERRVLASVEELRATLEDTFHLTLPGEPELDTALQRLLARSAVAAQS